MEKIQLVNPSLEYCEEILSYKKEFMESGSSMDGTGPLSRCDTAQEYVRLCKAYENSDTVPEGKVDSHQFLAIRPADQRIVGMINFRHHIEHPVLKEWGGHIGYSVRPSERGKGYAKEMLRQVLLFCKEYGKKDILITCLVDNIASERVIRANGGVFERLAYEDEQTIIKRFWISL